MKIVVDGFGGDNSPHEILKGCAMAVAELGVDIIVTGDINKLQQVSKELGVDTNGITFVNASSVIPVEEDPSKILKEYSDSSMAAAFNILAKGEADAFVSAGSTGAIVLGATFMVKRIKGVKRAGLATIIPNDAGCYMLLDAGANLDCRPEILKQFGIMGAVYMDKVMGISSPKVGLVNVGAEETKGTEALIEAHKLLKESNLNFVGNVEARDLQGGSCHVAVADGMVGNIILKLTEGLAIGFMKQIKGILMRNFATKLCALVLKKGFKEFKKKMDYTEYGGAPLLGISKPVIKAHGSSNAKSFKNAIRQAKKFTEQNVIGTITDNI